MALSLPPEILDQIFSYLTSEWQEESQALAGLFNVQQFNWHVYASVCKQWQAFVERKNFTDIHLTPARLPEFCRIFGLSSHEPSSLSKYRRRLLKSLTFKVVLPEYDVETRARVENKTDRNQNSQIFTDGVKALWEVLSTWPESSQRPLSLRLCAQSPSDHLARHDSDAMLTRFQKRFETGDILGDRYENSFLELKEDLERPIKIIDEFITETIIYRQITPVAALHIISRLPRLKTVNLQINDPELNGDKEEKFRDRLRQEFSRSISDLPQSVDTFRLDYAATPLYEKRPALQRSLPGCDSLSLALHNMSQQLVYIELLNIMISPELFWSPGNTTQWPKLQTFHLSFASATCSGEWLLEKDPRWRTQMVNPFTGEIEPDDVPPPDYMLPDVFRIKPTEAINTLYVAAGQAAQNMPQLKSMKIVSLAFTVEENGLEYLFDEMAEHWLNYQRSEGKATWISTSEFHPSNEVRETWNEVAKSHGHREATIENLGFHGRAPHWEDDPRDFDESYREQEQCFSWDNYQEDDH
ncbi:hypothetical protein N7448_010820 [Penicillium atrosanguineum]|nr:hypothetical protein N7526_010749 [Penicillium atrosanguineum]KAJ5120151.1 hypothetical protein N7448_010820 [Penicillium atrosanguineum]